MSPSDPESLVERLEANRYGLSCPRKGLPSPSPAHSPTKRRPVERRDPKHPKLAACEEHIPQLMPVLDPEQPEGGHPFRDKYFGLNVESTEALLQDRCIDDVVRCSPCIGTCDRSVG